MKVNNFDNPVIDRRGDIQTLEEYSERNNVIMSDEFVPDKTYNPGDFVIYKNALWKCLVTCIGVIPTEGLHWTKTSLGKVSSSLFDEIAKLDNQWNTDGLTFDGVNLVTGGYAKIGSLVVVNMRLQYTKDAPAYTVILRGLPKYNASSVCVQTWGESGGITRNGELSVNASKSSGNTVIVNSTYITNEV